MLKELYLKNSQLPKRYLQEIYLNPAIVDIDSFSRLAEIKKNIKEFVKSGKNLLICSNNVGNGKTTMATKLLKEYVDSVSKVKVKNNCPALFINVNNFLNEKKLSISDQSKLEYVLDTERKILESNLVVFDDLGVKNISDYDMGSLYYWIDERTNNLKTCIYTSNLLPKQLEKVLDPRLYSRIVKYSEIVYFKDGDNR